jgi:N-acetyl-alpha-D-muramate 1-phosphate uridylyltransferase
MKRTGAMIKQAMIFSAGLGTRFKPWTDKHPKALAIVNGKSLLQRNVEYLQQYGITDVIVNVHHFAEQIRQAIEKNKGWGSNIQISDETDEVLETGGGLLKAKDLFKPGEPFLTLNVDILTDLDLERFIRFHEKQSPLITLSVTDRDTSRYLLFNPDSRLCGWRNTTSGDERITTHCNILNEKAYSCVAAFNYEVFRWIPFTGKFSLIDVYLALANEHLIIGYDHSGDKLVDVGKPDSIQLAEALFS